jgi:hypothetical protein
MNLIETIKSLNNYNKHLPTKIVYRILNKAFKEYKKLRININDQQVPQTYKQKTKQCNKLKTFKKLTQTQYNR